MDSTNIQRNLQAQLGQAQAAQAQARGEGKPYPARACRDGLSGCDGVTQNYVQLVCPCRSGNGSQQGNGIPRLRFSAPHLSPVRAHVLAATSILSVTRFFWSWDWSHYGFIAPESAKAGYREPVGHFPFDTSKQETEESFCGFTQLSWHNGHLASQLSRRDLIRVLTPIYRRQGRL